jgi:predicted nucleic acid-binding protein
MSSAISAVLDANVLYPFTLRDTLLRAAERGMIRVYWSREILNEVRRTALSKGAMKAAAVDRLFRHMEAAFPEAMVAGHESLTATLKNHPKDRHVAAVALHARASLIVTRNLKDFKPLPAGIRAVSPDDLLLALLQADEGAMTELIEDQAAALAEPPVKPGELLQALSSFVPGFAAALTDRLT